MHSKLRAFLCLALPAALALHAADADAKKKKKKDKVEEAAPAATPAPETPPPAEASASATVKVDAAVTTPPPPTVPPPIDASVNVGVTAAVPPVVVAPPAAPEPPPPPRDRVRFRGGVSAGIMPQFFPAYGLNGVLGAVDGHLGVQIRNLVGIYVVPHVAFGSWFGIGGPFGGLTGNVAATAVVDFTIKDRFFAGLGAGGGVINAPAGAVFHARLGGYPVMKRSLLSPRRKALMVGADIRSYFISDGAKTVPVVNLMIGVGYEAY